MARPSPVPPVVRRVPGTRTNGSKIRSNSSAGMPGPWSDTWMMAVPEQGPGIPAEELERIFEPFVRVPGTRRTTGGTGLGLAIARQLAVRQGEELTVVSSPGAGATFSLSLPLGASPS
jgi:signal transduction histidine kinase